MGRKVTNPQILKAREDAALAGVPGLVLMAYEQQVHNCRRRGVPLLMGVVEWWRWWQEPAPDGMGTRWSRRGRRGADALMMLRVGDAGAYEAGNVYCGTSSDNSRDAWRGRKPSAAFIERGSAALRAYMSKRVARHGVEYPSLKAASDATGLHYSTVSRYAAQGKDGWRYA